MTATTYNAGKGGVGDIRDIDKLAAALNNHAPTSSNPTTLKIDSTTVDATALEINRAADLSTRVVALNVSTAITVAAHSDKILLLGGAGSARTMTLPTPSGTGAKFRFLVGAVNTSNYLVKAAAGTDVFKGTILTLSDNTNAALGWTAGATDDTLTLNGTTTGGVAVGDWVEFTDVAAAEWLVTGITTSSGTEATPFSDTVT